MTATSPLHPQRYIHTIHAAPACERLRHLYTGVFGGIVFSENYFPPEDRDAALLYVADHMIEIMAPRHTEDLSFMFARYLKKAGPSYHSISFKVANCDAAHQRCRDLGILINTVGPGLIYLHPKSTGGIVMELTDHQMPNDPYDLPSWRGDWAVGRPDRPHGIDHIVCAPRVPAAAIGFLVDRLEGNGAQAVRGDVAPARYRHPGGGRRYHLADPRSGRSRCGAFSGLHPRTECRCLRAGMEYRRPGSGGAMVR